MHFETIWNEAESLSKSFTDLNRKDILKGARTALDDLADSDEKIEYDKAMGDILYHLCALCAHLETKKKIQVNSATSLTSAINRKREELLDNNDDMT